MEIETRQVDDILVVTLNGEIDGRNAPVIQEKLMPLAALESKVLLIMSGVAYMSSAGLRTLLMLYRQINNNNGCIALACLPEMIQDMMSMTGFLDFFVAYPTEEEALAALRGCDDNDGQLQNHATH
ncbi:MAG: anti-sigma factor antagonist [Chloroflexi bacterium]|nr:anti-sigma factor antagonist [Chloroflexota bacterium]